VHPAGADLAEVAEHLLGGGLAEQPEDRDQHQHGREQGEHAVVGQRGGAVGDVVVLELADRALQDASHPALGMSVSVRGAGPDRAAGAAAVPSLPPEPAGRAVIASVRRPVTVAVAA
jgi:hypothetical protein